MIIIGELINGMYKRVAKAIADHDTAVITKLACDQAAAGAHYLDVNTGPYSENPADDMAWLVRTIQGACDLPLSIDSTRIEVMKAGLALAAKRPIINSTSADPERMDVVFALAKKHHAQVIGIAMDASGIPNTKDRRVELAAAIVAKAMESGIAAEDVYLDPVAMPVNVAQPQAPIVLESIRDFRMIADPAPQSVIGLSNVSQGARSRKIINRTFLVMAIANGLTAAIVDPLDTELMDAMITAELLANAHIYCDSFLEAYRKR